MEKHKLKKFAKIIKAHIVDEYKIHRNLIAGKKTLKQHFQDTLQIHKKAHKKLKKLFNE